MAFNASLFNFDSFGKKFLQNSPLITTPCLNSSKIIVKLNASRLTKVKNNNTDGKNFTLDCRLSMLYVSEEILEKYGFFRDEVCFVSKED